MASHKLPVSWSLQAQTLTTSSDRTVYWDVTVTVAIAGVAVTVMVTGGGQVEAVVLKTLELGFDEVVCVVAVLLLVVIVVDIGAELDDELVVEDTVLVVDVGDGEAEVDVVLVRV